MGAAGRARSRTSTCNAQWPDGDDRLLRLPHADHARGRQAAGHAAGDRHDLAPRLRLRDRVPADRRGPLPRGRREGHRVPARPHAHGRRGRGHRLLGARRSTPPAARRRRSSRSEFGDDYDAIPAYEQIYALAGPTQTFRVTGDPRIQSDIELTHELFNRFFLDREGGASSRTSTRSRSTRAARRSAHNQARKNWNSVGDHAPAFLINAWLATGERRSYADFLAAHGRHDRQPLPRLRQRARS